MKAAGVLLAMGAVLATAAPAAAQDVGLGAASQAGRVTLGATGAARVHGRAGRAVRTPGDAQARLHRDRREPACGRRAGAKIADCTVTATDEVVWTGTATVTRGRKSYRVEYFVSG